MESLLYCRWDYADKAILGSNLAYENAHITSRNIQGETCTYAQGKVYTWLAATRQTEQR